MQLATQSPFSNSIRPAGSALVDRTVRDPAQRAELLTQAATLPQVALDAKRIADLWMLAVGAFSPLTGFLGKDDHRNVVRIGRLASGAPWPLPIVLPIPAERARELAQAKTVALVEPPGRILALLDVTEVHKRNARQEAQAVFATTDPRHPGVASLMAEPTHLLAGDIRLVQRPTPGEFAELQLEPAECRTRFAELGWRRVVGFQTRNPIHRAHEYLLKCALEVTDGLLLHPLVGESRPEDIPADVRMRCYHALVKRYFPANAVILAVNPAWMRFAGPREAIFHALVRKNFGCTHFIVGRDHAGVGGFYDPLAAQDIFDTYEPNELGITPLFFDNAFYCFECQGMASAKTCPHPAAVQMSLSGTTVRQLLAAGEMPPRELSRPEVADVLLSWWHDKASDEQGTTA